MMEFSIFRHHKKPCGSYESGSIRMFQLGRTETIRSCSTESFLFTKAMLDSNTSNQKKVELLKKAIERHKQYTNDVSFIKHACYVDICIPKMYVILWLMMQHTLRWCNTSSSPYDAIYDLCWWWNILVMQIKDDAVCSLVMQYIQRLMMQYIMLYNSR